MKLTTLIMIISLSACFANSKAQKINLNIQNAALLEVLNEISKQTDVKFFYKDQIIEKFRVSEIHVKDASLTETLGKLLPGNNLEYRILADVVSITASTKQEIQIQGTIKDASGTALQGASILVMGTNRSTLSDKDGKFTIMANVNATLQIKFLGYKSQEIKIAGRKTISITLDRDTKEIEAVDVVVTGYQEIDRRKFTGASTKIKAEDAQRFGVPDVSRMLEGQVSGVSVQNVSGTFGAAPKIRVRGATSITGDNKPLWVIDGIPLEDVVNISNDQLSTGDANTLLGSSVAGINPDDIESFEILKDAAATSLYGARAMNGVIIITTKKGKAGTQAVSYLSNSSTFLKPNYNQFDIVNSYDQMSIYAELARKGAIDYALIKNNMNSGIYGNLSRALITWDSKGNPIVENTVEGREAFLKRYVYQNTDWFNALFNNSFQQEHSLSFSSGNEIVQNYFSTSFLKDNGWAKSNNVQRYTANIRSNYKINNRLDIGLISSGSIRDQIAPGTLGQNSDPVTGVVSRDFDINPFSYAMNTSRVIAPYDQKGNLEYITMNFAPFNILEELNRNYMELKMLDLKVQGEINYKLPFGLKLSSTGAYRYASTGNEHKIHEASNMANAYRAGTVYEKTGIENNRIMDSNRFLYRDPSNPDARPVTVLPYGAITLDVFMAYENGLISKSRETTPVTGSLF